MIWLPLVFLQAQLGLAARSQMSDMDSLSLLQTVSSFKQASHRESERPQAPVAPGVAAPVHVVGTGTGGKTPQVTVIVNGVHHVTPTPGAAPEPEARSAMIPVP